ncbi:MAG: sigma-70 family RNA polymerase sigma factor [Verrucomicrobia bacterium]|nr:sigma-70 family RNA polymerase sigma factor [Verrucomicrobiota bacterium]
MPPSPDTWPSDRLGTERGVFATTHWTVVLSAADKNSPGATKALEKLCRTYWYPLYSYVRRKGHDAPEAEDLTQEFFARLLSRNFPHGIKPDGGRFRSYLLTALRHFLTNEWQRARAEKRGGGKAVLSLQELDAEGQYRLEPADNASPETLFDRRWASVLLAGVQQRLQREYAAEGRADLFARLQPCLTGAEQLLPYAELARELGQSESAVKMAVHRMRKRYGELLRQEISQTVAGSKDVEEEIRALLAVV